MPWKPCANIPSRFTALSWRIGGRGIIWWRSLSGLMSPRRSFYRLSHGLSQGRAMVVGRLAMWAHFLKRELGPEAEYLFSGAT